MRDNYRINLGNGQIHYAGSLRDCLSWIARHGDGFSFIQFRDSETNEWFTYRWSPELDNNENERFQDAMEQSQ